MHVYIIHLFLGQRHTGRLSKNFIQRRSDPGCRKTKISSQYYCHCSVSHEKHIACYLGSCVSSHERLFRRCNSNDAGWLVWCALPNTGCMYLASKLVHQLCRGPGVSASPCPTNITLEQILQCDRPQDAGWQPSEDHGSWLFVCNPWRYTLCFSAKQVIRQYTTTITHVCKPHQTYEKKRGWVPHPWLELNAQLVSKFICLRDISWSCLLGPIDPS